MTPLPITIELKDESFARHLIIHIEKTASACLSVGMNNLVDKNDRLIFMERSGDYVDLAKQLRKGLKECQTKK